MRPPRKIALITLGCPKNDVDSEILAGELARSGAQLVGEDEADTLLINTCGFIEDARKESIEVILRAVEFKEKGRGREVYVCGCLSGRYGEELRSAIPEVDGWFGVEPFEAVGRTLIGSSYRWSDSAYGNRPLSTPAHSAYLKIADGCDHRCSFCAIPMIKGTYRSRRPDSLAEEAQRLAERGVKELILIAQDTTAYGRDLAGDTGLTVLLQRLIAVKGLRWIRIMYAHPRHVTDALLEMMASEEKICSYLDIPLQHISGEVLRNMGRGMTRKQIEKLIHRIRSRVNRVVLRTVFITGFPGETEEMFRELLEFIKEVRFERLGAFVYSPEEGTRAFTMGPPVNRNTARRRYRQIMETQRVISSMLNGRAVGTTVPVLVDGKEKGRWFGRTEGDCLDIDQRVWIANTAVGGEIVPVRITGSSAYDLTGIRVP